VSISSSDLRIRRRRRRVVAQYRMRMGGMIGGQNGKKRMHYATLDIKYSLNGGLRGMERAT